MGTEQGARIIDGDSVRNVPENDVYTDDLIEQIVRRVAAENENA
ncbi:hypothetical protein [Methyloceanibacter stevinii]|nr:hypothetical protein [Methyloceanibacter stevinii]